MMLRLFCMLGGSVRGFRCFRKPKHQLIFLSLYDCEVKLSDCLNKHCYNKTGHAGEDRRQRYEIERVSCKNGRGDHHVAKHKLRELPLRLATARGKLNGSTG